jgi:hypothetical protein
MHKSRTHEYLMLGREVLRSFVEMQITDRQNVAIQIVCKHKNVDITYYSP